MDDPRHGEVKAVRSKMASVANEEELYAEALLRYQAELDSDLEPDARAIALAQRGWAFAVTERHDEAFKDFIEVFQDPDGHSESLDFVQRGIGWIFGEQNRQEKAERWYALSENDWKFERIHSDIYHLNEAIFLARYRGNEDGAFDDAIASVFEGFEGKRRDRAHFLEKFLDIIPADLGADAVLAQAWIHLQDEAYDDADEILEIAVESSSLSPSRWARALLYSGDSLIGQERIDEAGEFFDRVLEMPDARAWDRAYARERMAFLDALAVSVDHEDTGEGIGIQIGETKSLAVSSVSSPSQCEALLRLGWNFPHRDDTAEGLDYSQLLSPFEQVLAMPDLTPKDRAEAQGGMGVLLQRLGRDDEAWTYLSEALACPDLSRQAKERVLYAQAKILERRGHIGSALRTYDVISHFAPFRDIEVQSLYPSYPGERDALFKEHWGNTKDLSDDMRYEEASEFGRYGSRTGRWGAEASEVDEGNLSAWAMAGLGLYRAALAELDYFLEEEEDLLPDHEKDIEAMREWISARKSDLGSVTTEPLIPQGSSPEGLVAIAELRSQANFHLRTQRIDEAFALYDEIFLHPHALPFHRADALERKGTYLLDQGEGGKSLSIFIQMEGISNLPGHYRTMATLRRADTCRQMGRKEDAIVLYEGVIKSRDAFEGQTEYAKEIVKLLRQS